MPEPQFKFDEAGTPLMLGKAKLLAKGVPYTGATAPKEARAVLKADDDRGRFVWWVQPNDAKHPMQYWRVDVGNKTVLKAIPQSLLNLFNPEPGSLVLGEDGTVPVDGDGVPLFDVRHMKQKARRAAAAEAERAGVGAGVAEGTARHDAPAHIIMLGAQSIPGENDTLSAAARAARLAGDDIDSLFDDDTETLRLLDNGAATADPADEVLVLKPSPVLDSVLMGYFQSGPAPLPFRGDTFADAVVASGVSADVAHRAVSLLFTKTSASAPERPPMYSSFYKVEGDDISHQNMYAADGFFVQEMLVGSLSTGKMKSSTVFLHSKMRVPPVASLVAVEGAAIEDAGDGALLIARYVLGLDA
jgi:hypothetical protein